MSCCRVKVTSTLYYGFHCVSRKMNWKRTQDRKVEKNDVHKEIPSQVEQVGKVSQGDQDDQLPIVEGGNDVPVFNLS